MMRSRTLHPDGFTLIELLVVVSILAILAALLLSVFFSAREKARQVRCLSNQRQLADAILLEAADRGEVLPAAADYWSGFTMPRKVFVCPNVPNEQYGYLVNALIVGKPLNILDNPEKRILTADAAPGTPLVASLTHAAFRHRGHVIASFLDGHVAVKSDLLAETPIYYYDTDNGINRIMRVYGDGSGASCLEKPGTWPSVAAGGGFVTFYRRTDAVSMTYYVMDANGQGTRPVVTAASGDIADAEVSPDGRYLYYLANDAQFNAWGLYRITLDGRGRRQLKALPNYTLQSSLAVSPDGTQIVYAGPNWGSRSDLYLVKSDGSSVRQLTHDGISMHPAFHPDGQELVYVTTTADQRNSLHLMDTDGHPRQRILDSWRGISSPSFTPDGRYIVFHGCITDYLQIAISAVKTDGSDLKIIFREQPIAKPGCGVN